MRRLASPTLILLGVALLPVAWGEPRGTSDPAPVSVGPHHGCGILDEGAVWCWGKDDRGQASPPDGAFLQISAGSSHTCALDSGAHPVCWGSNDRGQSRPPEEILGASFLQISAGEAHTCGVLQDGSVRCWGCRESAASNTALLPRDEGQCTPPNGTFKQVSAGHGQTCGVRADGIVACWGSNASGCATPPTGKFVQVSATQYRTCGLRDDGTLTCWGRGPYGESTPPPGEFQQVATGAWHTCGLRSNGTVACWGNDRRGQCNAPGGVFTGISASGEHACGVAANGTVTCWGDNQDGQSSPYATPPDTGIRALVEQATRAPELLQELSVVLICPSPDALENSPDLAIIRVTRGRKLTLVNDWGQHPNPTLARDRDLPPEQYQQLLDALLSVDWSALVGVREPAADLQVSHSERPGALLVKLPAEPLCTAAWRAVLSSLRIPGI
jgi:hypothetical protein